MKKTKFIFAFALITIFSGLNFAQVTNPPPVLHREITWASQTPEGPAVFEAVNLFVGEDEPTNQTESGEDWWYDTKPIYENSIHTGYIVVGFTTYKNMYFSEHQLSPPGFENFMLAPLVKGSEGGNTDDCPRLLSNGETISQYRQVIARFDLKGRMVWCKPLNYGLSLNSVIQHPTNGTFYAIGETTSAYKYGDVPQKYLYNPTQGAANQPLVDKINPVDINDPADAVKYRKPRILLYHFDVDGTVLWSNLYGSKDIYDLSGPTDPNLLNNSNTLKDMQIDGADLALNVTGTELIILG